MRTGRYDALFIDFYGTLVTGDREAVEETCAAVVADHALDLTAGELAALWGARFFEAIEISNDDRFINLFECECRTLCATVEPMVGPIDPVPYCKMLKDFWSAPALAANALEALADIRVPICVVSNADTEDIHCAIERHGIRVDAVVTSEDTRSYKPHGTIFEAALARLDVRPDRVLHAGDSLHSDVGGAKRLGIASCWVQYQSRILDIGRHEPDHKIRDLLELHTIL
jgi:2-haloacid dehalogenase/putative hydrolase of the HAD superfamily